EDSPLPPSDQFATPGPGWRMSSLVERLMPSTGTGYRPTSTFDGQGGWTEAAEGDWAAVAGPGARCKYDPGSVSEPVVADQQRGELAGRLFVLEATDIQRGDLWILDDGRRLKIEQVQRPGGRGHVAGGQKVATV